MWRETTLFDLQVSKYQLQIILESRMKIGVAEVNSARSRFESTLQLLVDKKDDGHYSSDDSPVDVTQSDQSPIPSPNKRSLAARRKRKRRDDQEMEMGQYHHTYVMKLFDRSVDLAQFDEDSPLYPICRAWLKNQPGNRNLIPQPRTPTPEPEVEDDDAEIQDVYKMPPPIKQDPDDHTDYRIPHPVPQPVVDFIISDSDDAPNSDDLLEGHMERWRQVRQSWIDQGRINEMRYSESMQVLKDMFDTQMKEG